MKKKRLLVRDGSRHGSGPYDEADGGVGSIRGDGSGIDDAYSQGTHSPQQDVYSSGRPQSVHQHDDMVQGVITNITPAAVVPTSGT